MSNDTVIALNGTAIDPAFCTVDICSLDYASVDYVPNLAANALFAALFGLLVLVQGFQTWKYRTLTYGFAIISGLILEVVGYVGRIMMHNNPFDSNAFLIYLICLTIAPVFVSAAIYICLGRIVAVYGVEHSRIRPRTYSIIFMSCDFLALVLQAAGGAIADTAADNSTTWVGIDIMIAGLAFQVVSLVAFAVACGDYAYRVKKNGRSRGLAYSHLGQQRRFHIFMSSLAVATVLVIIRSCFRVAELKGGFNSSLANNEVLLMVFDGAMISLATILMTTFHPGPAFEGFWAETSARLGSRKGAASTDEESMEELRAYKRGAVTSQQASA